MPLLKKLQSIQENKQDDAIDINEETSVSITSVLASNDTTPSTQVDQTEVTIQSNSNVNKSTPKTSKKANVVKVCIIFSSLHFISHIGKKNLVSKHSVRCFFTTIQLNPRNSTVSNSQLSRLQADTIKEYKFSLRGCGVY